MCVVRQARLLRWQYGSGVVGWAGWVYGWMDGTSYVGCGDEIDSLVSVSVFLCHIKSSESTLCTK